MARPDFEELEVYRLAEELADRVWKCVADWPPLAQRTVGEQVVRAADSVGANIAEGRGRRSSRDNRRFVRIAQGSLNETQHFLRRAFRRKLLDDADIAVLAALVEQLGPKLNAYHAALDRLDLGEDAEGYGVGDLELGVGDAEPAASD